MLTRLPSARGLEWSLSYNWPNLQTRPPMYFCQRCSQGTDEGSAVVVCSIPFCLDCACADPQVTLMIAEEHLSRRYDSKQTAFDRSSLVIDGDADGTPRHASF
jgi:hypothetical protein